MKVWQLMTTSALALSVCTGAAAVDDVPCVEDKQSVNLYWPAVIDWNPYPRDAEFISAEAYEHDTFTPNDSAGRGQIQPPADGAADPQICLEIRNFDGFLFGPNSEVLNYFGEGECIEIFMEVEFRYPVKRCNVATASISAAGMSAGGTITDCWEGWATGTIRTKVKEVCPCDEN